MLRYDSSIRDSDNYSTPKAFYQKLNEQFNFDFDPTPLHSKIDGLTIDWHGVIYINPPYSNIEPFIQKGIEQLACKNAIRCVYLIPLRSDTRYWHNLIMRYASEIIFIKGRLNFNELDAPAPFPCVLIVFDQELAGELTISAFIQASTMSALSIQPSPYNHLARKTLEHIIS